MNTRLSKYVTGICLMSCLFIVYTLPQQAIGQQYIQIGNGSEITSDTEPSPINIWFRSLHGQVVYTKEELNAAGFFGGSITELGFYIETAPIYDIPNYTIGIKTTMQGDTNTYDGLGFTTVYNTANYTPTAGGFDMLTFDTPFFWSGTENLLIDICFDPVVPTYSSSGTVRADAATYGFRFTLSDESSQCGVPTNSFTGRKPQLQLATLGQATDDAGVSSLNAPVDFCAGNQDIIVEVNNFGVNVIDSVQVNWTFNDIAQPSLLLTMPLDTFGGTGVQSRLVTLGSQTFANGSISDLEVWTSFPNGLQDTVSVNDTLRTVLQPSLNGTYTIGGSTADYTTISDAVADLNAYGVCGPTTFNIRTGFYDEQFTINQFRGHACDTPVIFQSETGDSTDVVINDVNDDFSNNYIVQLDGADGVTFSNISIPTGR